MARSKSPAANLHDIPLIGAHLPEPTVQGLAPLVVTVAVAALSNTEVTHKDGIKSIEMTAMGKSINTWMNIGSESDSTKALCAKGYDGGALELVGSLVVILYMVGCAQRNTGGHWITSMANTFLSAYGGMMGVAFLSGGSLMEYASDSNIKLVIFAWSLVNASKIHSALKPLEEVFDNEILGQVIDIVYQLYRAHWAIAGMTHTKATTTATKIIYGVAASNPFVLPLSGGMNVSVSDEMRQCIWACALVTLLAPGGIASPNVQKFIAMSHMPTSTSAHLPVLATSIPVYFLAGSLAHHLPN